MSRSYIEDDAVKDAIQKIESGADDINQNLWSRIVEVEFPISEDWHPDLSILYGVEEPEPTPHLLKLFCVVPDREYEHQRDSILIIHWRHQNKPDKHAKLEDDASEIVMLTLTCSADPAVDQELYIAASTGLSVKFYHWTGREADGSPDLSDINVSDPITGEKYPGLLHLVDDADAVHVTLQDIKQRSLELARNEAADNASL